MHNSYKSANYVRQFSKNRNRKSPFRNLKMPDTLHINNKATAQNTYDAIVIGSGISGGWAAKELTEKGLKVLMLERGRNFEHVKDYVNATKGSWEFPHRG